MRLSPVLALCLLAGCASSYRPLSMISVSAPDLPAGEGFVRHYVEKGHNLRFRRVLPTDDGGAFVVGQRYPVGRPDRAGQMFAKLGRDGTPQWRTLHDPGAQSGLWAALAVEDGYLVAGAVRSADGQDGYLVRLGSDGAIRWTRRLPQGRSLAIEGMIARPGGGFLLAGFLQNRGGPRPLLMGVADNGRAVWHRTYGNEDGMFHGLQAHPKGGIAVGTAGGEGFVLIADPEGHAVESARLGKSSARTTKLQATAGGLVAGAQAVGDLARGILAAADGRGPARRVGGPEHGGIAQLRQLDGGYAYVAPLRTETRGQDALIVTLDASSTPTWSARISGPRDVVLEDLRAPKAGLLAAGYAFIAEDRFAGLLVGIRGGRGGAIEIVEIESSSVLPVTAKAATPDPTVVVPSPSTHALTPGKTRPTGSFGASVALEGELALVSDIERKTSSGGSGYVYLFRRTGDRWAMEAELQGPASRQERAHSFGLGVALHRGRVFVGTTLAFKRKQSSGAVVVYEKQGERWAETARLRPGRAPVMTFGKVLAADGPRLLAGGYGAAVLFVETAEGWIREASLPPPPGADANYGLAVALAGDEALVADAKSIHAFERKPSGWTHLQSLVMPNRRSLELAALGFDSDGAYVGVPAANSAPGELLRLERSASGWAFGSGVPGARARDHLGRAFARAGGRLWVGAPHLRPGRVFPVLGGRRQAPLTLPIRHRLGGCGAARAGAGDRLLVGCPISQGGTRIEGQAFVVELRP